MEYLHAELSGERVNQLKTDECNVALKRGKKYFLHSNTYSWLSYHLVCLSSSSRIPAFSDTFAWEYFCNMWHSIILVFYFEDYDTWISSLYETGFYYSVGNGKWGTFLVADFTWFWGSLGFQIWIILEDCVSAFCSVVQRIKWNGWIWSDLLQVNHD